MKRGQFSVLVVGDCMIVAPWSIATDRPTLDLFAVMRAADVTIANLETVIHTFKGYAQADSGGTWMTSPPVIADELAWAGVDMVSHANNHAFDYGSEGVLETIEHMERAGIVLSGSGEDLQRARAPQYLQRSGRKLAHVAMASTFVAYGKASPTRADMRGRPGINPLTVLKRPTITVTSGMMRLMQWVDNAAGRDVSRYGYSSFKWHGITFRLGEAFRIERGRRPLARDAEANLDAIARARSQADIVVASVHSHEPSGWLRKFVRRMVAAGADIVVVHGRHEICPMEIVEGRPVFYGLGNFVWQPARVGVVPSEAYERNGLDGNASVAELQDRQASSAGLWRRSNYDAIAARVEFDGNLPRAVELVPIDSRFGEDGELAGCPRIADRQSGARIIGSASKLARPHGTTISYDAAENRGRLTIGNAGG